jgi:hypothetical protein
MIYKPDWYKTKERLSAWWEHEIMDRCVIGVTAPRVGIGPALPPKLPEKMEDRWLDFSYLHDLNEYHMSRTFYGGEAFPVWNPGYPGWDLYAVYLGAGVDLKEDTGWVSAVIEEGDLTDHDYSKFTIRPDNRWWRFSQEMHRHSVGEAAGKSLPGILALAGCGDTLAALRGTQNLLVDVMEYPDYVRQFELFLMKQWTEVYTILYGIIKDGAEGSTCWFNLWSPGRFYVAANDFAYMISPEMFTEIFLPAIEMQVNFLDHTIYHLDGPGTFAHVDALLELPKLQAFQVLPGAGNPSPLHYMDVLKKIQKAGRNLHIGLAPEEVETALEHLSARGLYIQTYCESEEEARTLLRNAEKWSKDR